MDMQKAAQGLVELGAAACSAQRNVRKLLGQHRDVLPDSDGIDWDLLGTARRSGTLLEPDMLERAEDAAAALDDAIAMIGREALDWNEDLLGLPPGSAARARALETVRCALLAWVEAGWTLADRIEAGALIGARLDERARQHAAARSKRGPAAHR